MINDRILALFPGFLRPDTASGYLRFAALLRAIESRFTVDLLMRGYNEVETEASSIVLRCYFVGRVLRDMWRGTEAAVYSHQYSVCIVEFWHLAEISVPLLRRISPWTSLIVDSVDVHFLREEAAVTLGLLDAHGVAARKCRELSCYNAADAVVVVTAEDKTALRAAGVRKPIHLIPNIVQRRERPAISRKAELLFIGGFLHAPNADGLIWFVENCWRMIQAAIPDACLTVVGSNPTQEILNLSRINGIEVIGYVPATEPYLDRAAVSIAPLRYGGGMKGKVCEALAAGVPLVTTRPGVQGLPIQDGVGARVCDDSSDFTDAVLWVLSNPSEAEAMGAVGQKIVDAVCGVEVVSKQVVQLFDSLTRKPTASQILWWRVRSMEFKVQQTIRRVASACGGGHVRRVMRGNSINLLRTVSG